MWQILQFSAVGVGILISCQFLTEIFRNRITHYPFFDIQIKGVHWQYMHKFSTFLVWRMAWMNMPAYRMMKAGISIPNSYTTKLVKIALRM